MKYLIRREIVFKPEVDLPEDCQVVSIEYNPREEGRLVYVSETWEVWYVEPVYETKPVGRAVGG